MSCGTYTRSKQKLCYACLCESIEQPSNKQIKPFIQAPLSYIKGNIAESLVLNLFVGCQFQVSRIGVEHRAGHRCGNALKQAGYTQIDVSHISSTPDLMITNPQTNTAELVEVKYRSDARVPYSDLLKIKTENTILLLFSKKRPIYCLRLKEIFERGTSFIPKDNQTLKAVNPFNIDVGMIEIFEAYTRMIFNGLQPLKPAQEPIAQ